MKRRMMAAVAVVALATVAGAPAGAVHFYRGPGGGCTPNDGALVEGDEPAPAAVAAEIMVLHNTFNDAATGSPVTVIDAGDSVRWTWNSPHCHSVDGRPGFYSGYHYPTATPESPAVAPALFHYPVPDTTPTLSWTRTFDEPGTYRYVCEHHAAIGMVGTVVVR